MTNATLPTKAFKPPLDPNKWMTTLHGAPGAGKSTFLSSFPHCLILDFEKSTKGVECIAINIKGVEGELPPSEDPNERPTMTLRQVCALIGKGGHDFKTIGIDTLSSLWECFAAEYRRINKVEDEETVKFAEGTKWVARKVKDTINWIRNLGLGVLIAAHTDSDEEGVHHLSCHKRIDAWANQESDQILYCKIVQDENGEPKHIIQSHGTWDAHAEDRLGVLPAVFNNDVNEYLAAVETAQNDEKKE